VRQNLGALWESIPPSCAPRSFDKHEKVKPVRKNQALENQAK